MRADTTTRVLLTLTVLAIFAQTLPFIIWPVPDPTVLAQVRLPSHYPAAYGAADYAKAKALDLARFWGNQISSATALFALLTLLSSGVSARFGAITTSKIQAWVSRLWFLVLVFVILRIVEFPSRLCRFLHYQAFGLTPLKTSDWAKLFLVGLAVPFVLFVLKSIFVACTLPLCKRLWWLAAASGLFLIGDLAPEILSRAQPLDPVEHLQPLDHGPHYEAMKAMLNKAGLDLPILTADESRRSQSANICLTGRAGREYVLLTDTFARQYSPDQVALALAHELGHFRHKTVSFLVQKSCGLLLLLFGFGLAFVLSGRQALSIASAPRIILLTVFCSLLVSWFSGPVLLAVSRSEERFADRFALQMAGAGVAYQGLLLRVAQHELEPLELPPLYYYLSASHPTPLERMALAARQ